MDLEQDTDEKESQSSSEINDFVFLDAATRAKIIKHGTHDAQSPAFSMRIFHKHMCNILCLHPMSENPVIAARTFLMKLNFLTETLLGMRKAGKSTEKGFCEGVLGRTLGFYNAIEVHARAALHGHLKQYSGVAPAMINTSST